MFAPLFASLILKEVLTKNVIIGGVLILIAVVLTEMEIIIKNIKKRRKN